MFVIIGILVVFGAVAWAFFITRESCSMSVTSWPRSTRSTARCRPTLPPPAMMARISVVPGGLKELVDSALASKGQGWPGVKVKIGKPRPREDLDRLSAVREAVGPAFDIMVDANQSMTYAEARRRAHLLEDLDLYWLEEPLPAEDLGGHVHLAATTSIPIAVGESIYSLSHFREYLAAGAAGIVQPDAARLGGITPWLKVAHLAEAFNVKVAPHFLMELHVSLAAAVPNAIYLEHIPQLRQITRSEIQIVNGQALAPESPGVGIDWDREAIAKLRIG